MNTTVIAADKHDLGAGPQERIVFVGCTWHVDGGVLHIIRKGGPDAGNVAAFAPGEWRGVIRGVVANAVEAKA